MSDNDITPAQAQTIIDAQRKLEDEACAREVNEVLQRRGYRLIARPVISDDGRIGAMPQLVRVAA